MGPVELLRNKRSALIRDDEAILLLLLGQGEMRPHELREAAEMPERSFWRSLAACHRQYWVISVKTRPEGKKAGRGLKSIARLTPKGSAIVRKLLGEEAEEKCEVKSAKCQQPKAGSE